MEKDRKQDDIRKNLKVSGAVAAMEASGVISSLVTAARNMADTFFMQPILSVPRIIRSADDFPIPGQRREDGKAQGKHDALTADGILYSARPCVTIKEMTEGGGEVNLLIVVDMQNDFIDGALGTREAQAIVPKVAEKIKSWDGAVIFTRDTHYENYMQTQEGKKLPVPHCIKGTPGWEIADCLKPDENCAVIDKPSFGAVALGEYIKENLCPDALDGIELVGLCTDICVISNALLLKAFFPEAPVTVDAACCAGVTPESHKNALEAMKMCQINVTE